MAQVQIVSTALVALALTATPVIVWAAIMYSTLQQTGAMLGALA